MRTTTTILVLIMICFSGCRKEVQLEWHEAAPVGTNYSIEMPGEISIESVRIENIGNLQMFVAGSAEKGYSFANIKVPTGARFDFAKAAHGVAVKYKGEVVSEADITIEGEYGREYELQVNDPKGRLAVRMAVIDGWLYLFIVAGENVRATDPNTQRFFHSFRFVERTTYPRAGTAIGIPSTTSREPAVPKQLSREEHERNLKGAMDEFVASFKIRELDFIYDRFLSSMLKQSISPNDFVAEFKKHVATRDPGRRTGSIQELVLQPDNKTAKAKIEFRARETPKKQVAATMSLDLELIRQKWLITKFELVAANTKSP
jgi:hypothetical protein